MGHCPEHPKNNDSDTTTENAAAAAAEAMDPQCDDCCVVSEELSRQPHDKESSNAESNTEAENFDRKVGDTEQVMSKFGSDSDDRDNNKGGDAAHAERSDATHEPAIQAQADEEDGGPSEPDDDTDIDDKETTAGKTLVDGDVQ